MLLVLLSISVPALHADATTGRQFIGLTNVAHFEARTNASGARVLISPEFCPAILWNQLVLSWNATMPPRSRLGLAARPLFPEGPGRLYRLGWWATDAGNDQGRCSVPGQSDEDAEVLTDTLALRRLTRRFQVELTLQPAADGAGPELKFLGIALTDTGFQVPTHPPHRAAWGQALPVPTRSQLDYAGGGAWCSPTSLTMLLAYWAERLQRRDLAREVPEVAAGVHDPNWPGTGNWPFNTAYAGSLTGMRAYVTRLADVNELEQWICAGVPVAASLTYSVLKGQPDQDDGHLVVCVGFSSEGDVVLNDPGTRRERRKTVPRDRFLAAWTRSHRTVYLVYPATLGPPLDRHHHWLDR